MISSLPSPIPLQKFAASVLLVMVVFQLGACPCGCLEHNAWFQLLGLSSHHHDAVASHGGTTVGVANHHDHDCTGEPAVVYLDNARPIPSTTAPEVFTETLCLAAMPRDVAIQLSAPSPWDCDRLAVAHAPLRPALQVYRL